MIYDGRSSGGAQVSVAGGGTQSFVGNLTVPPYGTYTHGIMLIDNSFTVQGELVWTQARRTATISRPV